MLTLLVQPAIRSLIAGVIVLSLPLLWNARSRGRSYTLMRLGASIWLFRGLGLAFCAAGLFLAASGDRRMLEEAGSIIAVGATAIALSEPLGRLLVGPAAMTVGPERIRIYWR